jgi:hypothetical protein
MTERSDPRSPPRGSNPHDRPVAYEPPKPYVEVLRQELSDWDQLWADVVPELVKVTSFPSILVYDRESERRSLRLLLTEICRIALSPKESADYRHLESLCASSRARIDALEQENNRLRQELLAQEQSHQSELARISERIDRFQSMVSILGEARGSIFNGERPDRSVPSASILTAVHPERQKRLTNTSVTERRRSMPPKREPVKRAAPPKKKKFSLDDLQSDTHVNELIARYTKTPKAKKKTAQSLAERSIKPHSSSVSPKSHWRKKS